MIPVAQLDPASLTLWYTPELLRYGGAGDAVAEAVRAAADGDSAAAVRAVGALRGGDRTRATNLLGLVWHEHRHFVDLCLTNYGAFRVRQYFQVYANLLPLLQAARAAGGELFCPVSAYADPVASAVYGIGPLGEGVRDLLGYLARLDGMLAQERVTFPSPYGPLELGGEAQLEALAHGTQYGAIGAMWGAAAAERAQADLPFAAAEHRGYNWAMYIAAQYDVATVRPSGPGESEVGDLALLNAIIYASLAVRRYGQAQASGGGSDSCFAFMRMHGLLTALRGAARGGQRVWTPEEAWVRVDAAARTLWGRSASDEMRVDLQREEDLCAAVAGRPETYPGVARALASYHDLRRGLVARFLDAPGEFLDHATYAARVLPDVRPASVFAYAPGSDGPTLRGHAAVVSHEDDARGQRWWWATARKTPHPGGIQLGARGDWLGSIVPVFAPAAKMLLQGRNHFLTVGPELLTAEGWLERHGVRLRFHPHFQWPDHASDLAALLRIRGATSLVCDWCNAPVGAADGRLVSPWLMQRTPAARDAALDAIGPSPFARDVLARDWSPWVACARHAELFPDL